LLDAAAQEGAGASSQFDASDVMQPVQALRGHMDAAGSSRKRTLEGEEVGVSGVSKEVQHMGGRLTFSSFRKILFFGVPVLVPVRAML